MKIGVFSDSHDHMENIKKVIEVFLKEKVDKIIHCGDIVAPFVIRSMESLKNCEIEAIGVYGNNDGERIGLSKILAPVLEIKKDFIECEWDNVKIAIYHGTNVKILDNIIDSHHYNLILTGHTHQIRIEQKNNVLIVNPGETCGYLTGKATCAIIDITKKPLKKEDVKIIEIV